MLLQLVMLCLSIVLVAGCNQDEKLESQAAPKSPHPVTQAEIEKLIQSTLDDHKLNVFTHPSEPGKQIRVSGNDLPPGVILNIHNEPVQIVEFCKENEDCLWINDIEVADSTVKISLLYDIQGVEGEYIYFRINTTWHLVYSNVVEH